MKAPTEIRILLVDDHEVVRRGLRSVLEMRPEWTVCGEASDGRTAVQLARTLQPQVVVMDLELPELNGFDATRQIVGKKQGPKVVILSMHESEQHVREALSAGAQGYVLKSSAGRELLLAVEALLQGKTFFGSQLAAAIHADEFSRQPRPRRSKTEGPLTPRERETAQLLAEGKSNKEVAVILEISVKTAETHRARVMRKLKIGSVADLVRWAIRNGMIGP